MRTAHSGSNLQRIDVSYPTADGGRTFYYADTWDDIMEEHAPAVMMLLAGADQLEATIESGEVKLRIPGVGKITKYYTFAPSIYLEGPSDEDR